MSVPEHRIAIAQAGSDAVDVTAVSRAVRGVTWIDAAFLQNWLAGRGSMDVPAHAPLAVIASAGSSDFRYWTKPRFQTARYAYGLTLTTASPTTATVEIGGSSTVVPTGTRENPSPVVLYRDRASLSTTEAELAITIEATGGQDVTVDCISVEAVPRTQLLVSNDLGADRLDYLARLPINEASLVTELLGRQNNLREVCRRVGLFQFSRGTDDPWETTSTSDANLFGDTFSLLGRRLFNGQTSTTSGITKWRALAKCSDGTTSGQLTLTGGITLAIPTSTTDWTWITGGDFSHDCEDDSSTTGYQSDVPDEHQITIKRTAGSGTVSVASVSFLDVGE